MIQQRLVLAINQGMVLDHIPAGQALKIMRLLHVVSDQQRITLGLNLASQRLTLKDLIKIENRVLTEEEFHQVSIFAPEATLNYIENFKISKKVRCQLPKRIHGIFICPNNNCISHGEGQTAFQVESALKTVMLSCVYCERRFERDQLVKNYL